MSLIAEFTAPPSSLPLGATLQAMPEMRIEIDRIVPSGEWTLPFFWVWGCDAEAFLDLAVDQQEISDVRLLEELDDGALFQARWKPDADVVAGLSDVESTIVSATGTAERWRFEVRARDREHVAAFEALFEDEGISMELRRLDDLERVVDGGDADLSRKQRKTLLRAYEDGYFEEPRETTLGDLAAEFDVSPRAVSSRLRRGTRNLIRTTMAPSRDEDVAAGRD